MNEDTKECLVNPSIKTQESKMVKYHKERRSLFVEAQAKALGEVCN